MTRIYGDRQHGCRMNEYGWRGHRLVVLENELLRAGALTGDRPFTGFD